MWPAKNIMQSMWLAVLCRFPTPASNYTRLAYPTCFVFFGKISVIKKSNHYTRGITPKRVTSVVVHLRGLATQLRKNVAAVASRLRHCAD